MKKIIISSAIIASLLVACKSTKQTTAVPVATLDCSNKAVTYSADIKPILEANCTKCHNANEKAGYNFLKIEFVKKSVADGHLLGTIKHQKGFDKMPAYAAKLDQAIIDKIECWINNGMKE